MKEWIGCPVWVYSFDKLIEGEVSELRIIRTVTEDNDVCEAEWKISGIFYPSWRVFFHKHLAEEFLEEKIRSRK